MFTSLHIYLIDNMYYDALIFFLLKKKKNCFCFHILDVTKAKWPKISKLTSEVEIV